MGDYFDSFDCQVQCEEYYTEKFFLEDELEE